MQNTPSSYVLLRLIMTLVMLAYGSIAYANIELQNATPITGIASSQDISYSLNVPQGATDLNFTTSGGSGDADLYVRYGAAPTTDVFDCRPFRSGNNETCDISNVQAGTYYVLIRPYSAFSGLSLVASFTATNTPPPPPPPTSDTLNESNLSGQANSEQTFTLNVTQGATNLAFVMSGGSGDADLYVKFGSQPTESSYDCRPFIGGSNESCPIANAQVGVYYVMIRAYSNFSGVSLVGSYDTSTGGGNNPPQAVIANGPFTGVTGAAITMNSTGSNDSDGTITGYTWNFGDGQSSTAANPTHVYANAGNYTVELTVTDNDNASSSVTSQVIVTAATSGFTVSSHYYDKGSFDRFYTNYEQAFSDNFTDDDVEIHSYIVINFNENVNKNTVNANSISVKRLNVADNNKNNQNLIEGDIQWLNNTTLMFKPKVIYYLNDGGIFDWNKPNWNGLKPNYEYTVTLANTIKSTSGDNLDTTDDASAWTFKTIDNDYGLYWFKDGATAMKYVPGRTLPTDYYSPNKPTHIYSHGWSKKSVHEQDGQLRDYRRESFDLKPGSMYPSQAAIDLVSIWKDPSKNHAGKAWNFGMVYWNQFSDDDYANLSKPQKAEAKIWSTEGKNKMKYSTRQWNGSSWSQQHVETNAPPKPVSVILADALIASTKATNNSELRLSANSLGNQIITGISYILKKEYAEGRISSKLFPNRLALLDPYWRNGSLQNSWTNNHPAYVDLGEPNGSPAAMTLKIVTDLIEFAEADNNVSFVTEYYDASRTTDGSVFGQSFGDRNSAQRDISAITYLQASWISGSESDRNYYANRHVYSRYWYLWQYAYAPPATGFSASSSDADIKSNMNYYKSTKIRYSISAGGNTPNPIDDNFELKSGSSWQQ